MKRHDKRRDATANDDDRERLGGGGEPRRDDADGRADDDRRDDAKREPAARPKLSGRALWSVTACFFVAITCLVAVTADDLGLTWDEPPYFESQRRMAGWFCNVWESDSIEQARPLFTKMSILASWVYNRFSWNFHPPLAGMLSNLTHAAFGWVLGEVGSRRLASGMELALAAAALFMFLARRYSVWVGGVAAASLVVMPRVFGDAHIAGTDMPLMAFWAFTALAFWNGLESRGWRFAFGVLLGLSFLVKFSAVLVVVPLVVWLVLYRLIANINPRGLIVGLVGTAVIGWPLGVAGVEIVRLAAAMRRHTQQEVMLRPVVEDPAIRELTGQDWPEFMGHPPPYRDGELRDAALKLLGLGAEKSGTTLDTMIGHAPPYSPREIHKAAERLRLGPLALDSFIAYEQPTRALGVSTRVPGWILFVPLVAWLIWSLVTSLWFMPAWLRDTDPGLRLWLAGLAIAPAVVLALNPTWWNETLPQLAHYFQISAGRQGALPDIEIFYLGQKHVYSLPWHNGWLLIAVTVPAAVLAASLVGVGAGIKNWRRDPLQMFFVLNMITLPLCRMLPTPAHDGVRLMLPTFFFLAGLAGWSFELVERVVERFKSEEYSTAPVLAVAAAFLLVPPAFWLFRTHPFELSYYNGLVGGLRGAQRLGFEPTYWYDAVTPAVLSYLNDPDRGLPRDATLGLPEPRAILESTLPLGFSRSDLALSLAEQRINPQVFDEMQQPLGRLRADIRLVNRQATDFPHVALLTHSSKASPFTRLLYALEPQQSWWHDGVRLFSLYNPRGVSRAWALWLLLDATDYSRATIEPRLDRELVKLARTNYRALYAAALRVTESGLDAALAAEDDAETLAVIRRLAMHRPLVEILLARCKEALVEATEIIRVTVDRDAKLLERLVETYDGYLPAAELKQYLDEGLRPLDADR